MFMHKTYANFQSKKKNIRQFITSKHEKHLVYLSKIHVCSGLPKDQPYIWITGLTSTRVADPSNPKFNKFFIWFCYAV